MKFQVAKETLERAMQKIDTIVPARDTQTLLSHVLLDVNKNQLGITASDMESTVRITLPVKDTEDGEIIVGAKELTNIARRIKSEEVVFAIEKNIEVSTAENIVYKVQVKGDSSRAARYDIKGSDKSHFPGISTVAETELLPLPQEILQEMIAKTFYSISQEDNRYIYNGLCLISEGNRLTTVGTDGRRLAAISRTMPEPITLNENQDSDIVVHAKAVSELQKILDYATDVKIGVDQRSIFFRVGNAELSSRLLEGKFPDYKKVIPLDFNVSFEIPREALLEALLQVAIMAEPPSYQVRFDMSNGKVVLAAKTPDKGNAEMELTVEYNYSPIVIGFNANYLSDILKSLSCEIVKLEFTDAGKPIVVRDMDDKDFIALVMPMKIGN